jgi:hypothetical protein
MRGRRSVTAAIVVAALGATSLARARDPERAAELFRQGREAMAAGEHARACQRFAESEAEDPREGTLINLAQCEEALGKLATARQYWQQAGALARALGDPRADYAATELARIDGRVPRLTIRLDGDAPPDTVVTRDGIEFSGASFGVELPAETGRHVVRATAPRRADGEYTVDLAEGDHRVVSVSPGAALPVATESALLPVPPPPARPSGTLRGVAYALGGLGVAALGTGAAFGIVALHDASAAAGHCQGNVCDAPGTSARNEERSASFAATVTLGSGTAVLAAGATLRILTPSREELPWVRRRLAYLAGGLGLASTSAGLVFAARAYSQQRESRAGCNGNLCTHEAAAERRDAIAAGDAATAALVAGGVLLAGGVVLWATGRPGGEPGVLTVGGAPGLGGSVSFATRW